MNSSKVIVLAVGAATLVGVAYYTAQEEENAVRSAAAPTAVVLKDLTTGTVERIEIQTPGSTKPVVLTRKGEDWFTDVEKGFRAEKGQITGILSSLEQDLEGEIVSSNPESFADFQVDENSGTRVKLFAAGAGPVADLIVGKDGPAQFTTYVRKPDEKQVVNANRSLSYLFKKSPDSWRDKVILDFGSDTITAVSSEGTSSTFELQKSGDTWKVARPEEREARMTGVTPLISTLANLRATEFTDAESTTVLAEMGLNPPRQKLTITHEDRSSSPGKPIQTVLLIGNPRGSEAGSPFYVKRADQADVALVDSTQVKTISPELDQIAVLPPPPSPAPASTETTGTVSATIAADPATTQSQAVETTTTAPVASPEPVPSADAAATSAPAALTTGTLETTGSVSAAP